MQNYFLMAVLLLAMGEASAVRIYNGISGKLAGPIVGVLVRTKKGVSQGVSIVKYTEMYTEPEETNVQVVGPLYPGQYMDVENFDLSLTGKYDRVLWLEFVAAGISELKKIGVSIDKKKKQSSDLIVACEVGSRPSVVILGSDSEGTKIATEVQLYSSNVDKLWGFTQRAADNLGWSLDQAVVDSAVNWSSLEKGLKDPINDAVKFKKEYRNVYGKAAATGEASSAKASGVEPLAKSTKFKPIPVKTQIDGWASDVSEVAEPSHYQGNKAEQISFVEACRLLGFAKPEQQKFLSLYQDSENPLSEKEKNQARIMVRNAYTQGKEVVSPGKRQKFENAYALMKLYMNME